MAAPSIPNLLSLRGSRGGGRGRFPSRGRGGGPSASSSGPMHDATIQGTDTDAAVSRLSAVELGYLDDPFAQYFVQNTLGASSRRLPIINRGTYTRTAGLDILIDRFLTVPEGSHPSVQERQIISLGAGTDTRALRLLSRADVYGVTYHEVDFPVTCTRKLNIVKATPVLARLLVNPTVEADGSWWSETAEGNQCRFWCHGFDLRQLSSQSPPPPPPQQQQQQQDEEGSIIITTSSPPPQITMPGLRTDIPTLLVSECCLCYLETAEARAVVRWFTDRLPSLGLLLYEPTKPDDPFGRTMTANLAARGIRMPTLLEEYREPRDQEARLREAGFEHAAQMTVDRVWDRWVGEEEKERVDALQGLDEVEEWLLLAGHYVIAWGWRGQGFGEWQGLSSAVGG